METIGIKQEIRGGKASQSGRKMLLTASGYLICGAGLALCSKGAIGLGAYDAVGQSLAWLTGLQIGTWSILLNTACTLAQFGLAGRNSRPIWLLQLPCCLLTGMVCNFILDHILQFSAGSFWFGLLLFLLGQTLAVLGVSMVMNTGLIPLPLEGLCDMIARKTGKITFARARQMADVISFAVICLLSLTVVPQWSIGAGTILGILFFGPALGIMMRFLKKTPLFMGLE